MNLKQRAALKTVSSALLACKRTGVKIRGQGDSLNAWCDLTYTNVEPGRGDPGVMVETHSVKHYGVYVYSGADDQLFGDLTEAGRTALRDAGGGE